jgi:hypothetical protein
MGRTSLLNVTAGADAAYAASVVAANMPARQAWLIGGTSPVKYIISSAEAVAMRFVEYGSGSDTTLRR